MCHIRRETLLPSRGSPASGHHTKHGGECTFDLNETSGHHTTPLTRTWPHSGQKQALRGKQVQPLVLFSETISVKQQARPTGKVESGSTFAAAQPDAV